MVVLTGSFLELSSTFLFLENEDDDEYERIGKRLCLKRNAWKSLVQRTHVVRSPGFCRHWRSRFAASRRDYEPEDAF